MKATIEGRVTVHLQWDPPIETIIETLPIQVWAGLNQIRPRRDSGSSTVTAR